MRRATHRTPLLGIAAVFAACVLVLFALAPSAFADEYGMSVAGTPVTSENAADVLDDGTVSYDSATHTLTLNGASLQDAGRSDQVISSTITETLNIVLVGENGIYLPSEYAIGVRAQGGIAFSGSGSLVFSLEGNGAECVRSVDGPVSVTGTALRLEGLAAGMRPYGITCENGDISLIDATVTGSCFAGIRAESGSIAISGSSVTLTPVTHSPYTVEGLGIAAHDIVIDRGSAVDVRSSDPLGADGALRIADSTVQSKVSPNSYSYAIGAISGDLSIENSTVVAEADRSSALGTMGNLVITGTSNVTVSSESRTESAIGVAERVTIDGLVTIDASKTNGLAFSLSAYFDAHMPQTPAGGLFDLYRGSNADDATAAAGSPFAAGADISSLIRTSNRYWPRYWSIREHVHTFDQQVASDKFLAEPATCSSPAEYYLSCTCGAMGDATFASGAVDADAHEWGEDDVCNLCGTVDPDQGGTTGSGQSGTTDTGKNGTSGGTAKQPDKGGSSLARTGDPLADAAALCVAAAAGALGVIASRKRGSRR